MSDRTPRVAIVNYGMGNTASMLNALVDTGAEVVVTSNPATIMTSDRIILPGVGSFPAAMRELRERALVDVLVTAAARGIPMLGVCLGMQLLCDSSDEDGGARGLGIIPGKTVKLHAPTHMGWNQAVKRPGEPLFDGISDVSEFYFCHGHKFVAERFEDVAAVTNYSDDIVTSAVRRGSVVGVQFHPEKSQRYGLQLLRNFVDAE